ncbi:MAG: PIN domain nuclease [Chloroflexi bacterium]|nr:PIN domain nuclease [Chloroflexota bacterium]
MVIADTSVWINLFRAPDSEHAAELKRLLRLQEVCLTGVVLAEILRGARSAVEFARLSSDLEALHYLEISREAWIKAAELGLSLRGQGRTVPLTDLSIAAIALVVDYEIYTLDRDFDPVPGLRFHHPEIN